ncbi:MAG TPA: P-loop NTPase fold protein, partial [Sphingomicrobium sp.]
ELAKRTGAGDRADARHLLFALLDNPEGYPHFTELADAAARVAAKRYIVAQLESGLGEGEELDAWREQIAERKPRPAETVGTLSDAPALIDTLGRQAFAEVLATRVKQVSETLRSGKLGSDSAFILHIDGPWGSGKSSILNFLKANLEKSDPPWLIVEFNAWRNQQRTPAWWPIISHVWGAVRRESPFKFKMARLVWLRWNMRMRWLPVGLSMVLTGVLLYFAWQAVAGQTTGVAGAIKDIGAAVIALVTLAGLALTTSRSIFFGSKNAAEAYVQSTVEPYRPVVRLFERLIGAIERPVAVFIDDIDRCECNYVIELLEGIQTLLRSAPVVYVVAGDRKWICSSFEKRYADFGGQIGMPGRPLGYLFLDKVFQLSTAIPRLSAARRQAYWKRLLESGERGARSTPEDVKRLEAEAEKELQGKTSHEEIQERIERSEEGSLEREALSAAAARQTTTRESVREAEHRLQPLADLLEPNPRAMKRLVNAYGLNQARAFLEGRKVEVEALARWTIVELRWPILADYLASNWTDIAAGSLTVADFPDHIRALLADLDVKEVFEVTDLPKKQRSDDRSGLSRLTVGSLGPILE